MTRAAKYFLSGSASASACSIEDLTATQDLEKRLRFLRGKRTCCGTRKDKNEGQSEDGWFHGLTCVMELFALVFDDLVRMGSGFGLAFHHRFDSSASDPVRTTRGLE